ncbi:MAG TPA: Hsp70 family protein [Pirellulales bacterium]|nr:Hsp70 family protein [Pirellulales bacterium]
MGDTALSREHHNLVGIDLGTTFSVIAHLDAKGKAVTLSNKDGDPLTPSAVYLNGNSAVVGKAAREAAAVDAARVALWVKRDMGGVRYSHPVDGRVFRPETLSAVILRKLKQDAERHIGPIAKAVITVPAFFNETRRKATEDAGRIAGLDVIDVLNEPTAAALSYAMAGQSAGGAASPLDVPGGTLTALVYDLGGGTFDVTVVRLAAKRFETLATDGAVQLGGKDWDEKIVQHIAAQFRERYGIDPLADDQRRAALTALAERSKILLSDLPQVPLECFHQEHSLTLNLSREQFEDLSRELLVQTQIVTDLVVEQARLSWTDIDRVLLVGGSTRMPMVKEMLRKATGKEPDDSLDADQVVARGAAIHAGIVAAKGTAGDLEIDEGLKDELKDVEVFNVNAYSLGIKATKRGRPVNAFVIAKNTQLPFAASRIFRLTKAGARHVVVKVLEGESERPNDNIPIGECEVTGLPPNLPVRSPVQVRLSYGANGRISVMALDMTGGRFAQAEIKREYGLTEDDIGREAEFVNQLKIR